MAQHMCAAVATALMMHMCVDYTVDFYVVACVEQLHLCFFFAYDFQLC